MSQHEARVICPGCGAEMNHHAIKIDYEVKDATDDPIFGGALQEVHTCPQCGKVELREAK